MLTREIDLDGKKVSLTMTASEVDGNTFAIGSAVLDSAEQAQRALPAMQTALLKNINGTVRSEKSASAASSTAAGSHQRRSLSIEATGTQQGKPVLLVGRFVAQDKRIFQVIILGEESKVVARHHRHLHGLRETGLRLNDRLNGCFHDKQALVNACGVQQMALSGLQMCNPGNRTACATFQVVILFRH